MRSIGASRMSQAECIQGVEILSAMQSRDQRRLHHLVAQPSKQFEYLLMSPQFGLAAQIARIYPDLVDVMMIQAYAT